jgi:hypothetical protein
MSAPLSPLPQLNRRVFEILLRELGETETMRFLSQLNRGSGNYTEERRVLFEKLSLDEIRDGVRNLPTDNVTAE